MKSLDLVPGTEFLYDPWYDGTGVFNRYPVLAGGRGSAKSWSVAQALLFFASSEPDVGILCTREFQKSIADSVHRLLSKQIKRLELEDFFDIQNNGIYGKNGSQFAFAGLKSNSGSLKSMEDFKYVWVEEGEAISADSWNHLDPTIRAEGSRIFVVYNPRFKHDFLHRLFAGDDPPPGTVYKKLNYRDNPWFPEALRPQMEAMKAKNPLMYKHIWEGECVPNLTTALWPWESIDDNRLLPGLQGDLARVVVSVDPAVTANKKSDETGIVVAGCSKGTPKHHYVLGDLSGRYSPETWARKAMEAYDQFEADAIVAETNQGGDMVESTIRAYCTAQGRPMPRFKQIKATRGKTLRAEPIAALYSQGLVHHIGRFPVLEEQMLQFNPADDTADGMSPDRVDALVHGLTELSGGRPPMKIAPGIAERFGLLGRRA